ncbi:MAG: hypothetical protein LBD47_09620 [Treponema sp.]|jgi:hypothetical protein|nr:hypothetical protein [Treponema sp.]
MIIRVEIVANHSVEENIFEAFAKEQVGKHYTKFPNILGAGSSGPRMGDAIWPEENFALVIWCEPEEALGIKRALAKVKEQFPGEGIKFFSLPEIRERAAGAVGQGAVTAARPANAAAHPAGAAGQGASVAKQANETAQPVSEAVRSARAAAQDGRTAGQPVKAAAHPASPGAQSAGAATQPAGPAARPAGAGTQSVGLAARAASKAAQSASPQKND